MNKTSRFISLALILLFSSCRPAPARIDSGPVLEDIPPKVVINQILTGKEGDNQADFIELYNLGTTPANLEGYTLWYQLKEGEDQIPIAQWDRPTAIPPLGYYALTLDGRDFDIPPDQAFTQPLVPSRGGLSLRTGDAVEDQVSWGTGPSDFAEGSPAPALTPGSSLARSLNRQDGTCQDTNDNRADFSLDPAPTLHNSGSPINHPLGDALQFVVQFPSLVKPGQDFQTAYTITNHTGLDLTDLQFRFTLPKEFIYKDGPGLSLEGDQLQAAIPIVEDGQTYQGMISLQADYTFSEFSLPSLSLTASNWPLPAFSGPIAGEIGGGAIPIGTARELVDREVVIQGTSTMYVGGFYAGSGAKFYVEDETGGIQVYVAGAGSSLVVPLGSTVQVRGIIQVYRDSIELVPSGEDQVQILQAGPEAAQIPPQVLDIATLSSRPEDFPGQLITTSGRIGRVEESSYSYEIDLFDEGGNRVSLYLDKDTGITIEEIQADQSYTVTGILELYDGSWQLYPRLQSDLRRVFPPGLYVEANPPITANPGEPFQVSYTVTNHDSLEDHDLVLRAPQDPQLEILEISPGGRQEGNVIIWDLPALKGGSAVLHPSFEARFVGDPEYVTYQDYTIQSQNWPDPASGNPSYTFAGDTVPIWAIQGPGDRSPYVRATLTTRGVVTGVFPELEGFWIQELQSDSDPATSPGLFISTGPDLPQVDRGDLVQVTGQVRESFQQTELEISGPSAVEQIGTSAQPVPIQLDPPRDNSASEVYFESLEGSLVSVPGTGLVVGPSTRYGEYALVLSQSGISRAWQNQDHGMVIHVDDGSAVTYESGDSLPYAVAVGDTVSDLIGPLSYTYGNYKIQPVARPTVQNQPPSIDSLKPASPGELRLMTWNAENLFDFVVPHPSDPPLPTVKEYKRDIHKVALTIAAGGYPTVVSLQEIENIGVLEDISAEDLLGDYDYQPFLIEGTDSRGIDVGYLVRGDQAEILDVVQYPPPGDITSRPPLLLEIQLRGRPERFYFLNNHFTSLSGGEEATEPRRNAQAAWNLSVAQELIKGDPDAYLAVLGDLNSYDDSLPLHTLEAGGLTNLLDTLPPEQRYTYIYEGNSQALDHILVNDRLFSLLSGVRVLHCNADYPLPRSDDESIFHKSDHDPLIATFQVP